MKEFDILYKKMKWYLKKFYKNIRQNYWKLCICIKMPTSPLFTVENNSHIGWKGFASSAKNEAIFSKNIFQKF